MDSLSRRALLEVRGKIFDLSKLNPDDDPRVGSGREDSDNGGTLSQVNGNKGSSLSKLGSTFVPVIVYLAVCLILFIFFRRKNPRVYAPRCVASLQAPEPPSTALPNGWFNWVVPFWKTPDIHVLNHGSLDGFFFLRFIKVLRNICFAGCLITWPILFPIHITGGRGQLELERLSIGNVASSNKLYANAVVAWLFFGFILFTVVRENIYYINIRQAYLSSPYYANRLSSRTVLITSIPRRYLDEARLRKLYGDSVKRVWIPRTSKGLVNMVKEREQTALRLEKAEIELITKANAVRRKQLKKGTIVKETLPTEAPVSQSELAKAEEAAIGGRTEETSGTSSSRGSRSSRATGNRQSIPSREGTQVEEEPPRLLELAYAEQLQQQQPPQRPAEEEEVIESTMAAPAEEKKTTEYTHPYGLTTKIPDLRGSVAAQYLPAESRPYHRPIGNFGRRVDTIRWCRRRLIDLNQQIYKFRKRVKREGPAASETLPCAFIEFDSQESAQAAHQSLAHHQPLHMAPRLLGIRPDEVVWKSLRMRWWERILRRFSMLGLIVAAVIFWSIPSAIVGLISNIESISKVISFLNWLTKLPGFLKGLLTGFVPAIALSMFMAIVPVLVRHCAEFAGVPSLPMVELFTQTAYFAFQVVQVFLVTTLTSAASGAMMEVLQDPMSVKDVLAQNLPMASNFYISYILIQCLANAGTAILQPFELLRYSLLSRIAKIPRTRYRVWRTTPVTRWGRDFPVFANLGVIAVCYACIAPLILAFAAVGMWFTHVVWRYNLIFVFDASMDSKGLFYPRALTHIIVGIYLATVCLIGLFLISSAIGPAMLMILFLVFTGLLHYSLVQAVSPMTRNLPQTLALEEELQEEEKAAAARAAERENNSDSMPAGAANDYYDEEQGFGDAEDITGLTSDEDDDDYGGASSGPEHGSQQSRAVEGAADVRSTMGNWLTAITISSFKKQLSSMGIKLPQPRDPSAPPSVVSRWLNPHKHADFIAIRRELMTLPDEVPGSDLPDPRRTYFPPEMWAKKPVLWILADEARVSKQEVAHTSKSTPISDVGARLDEKGRMVVDVEAAPFALPRLLL